VPGYVTLRADRAERRGGGVLIYVKEHLFPGTLSISTRSPIDRIACSLGPPHHRVDVLRIYRPPPTTTEADRALLSTI